MSDAMIDGNRLKARASYVGAATNVIQTTIKITFGLLGQSSALLADGLHSLSDLLSDFLVIIAVRFGSREADGDHPYGHRRFETIATIILGGSLIGISAAIIWHAWEHWQQPETLHVPDPITLGIAAVSILINEWLFHYTKRIAKLTRSKLLLANAWHQRSDVLSSVVVLCGIVGVMQGYVYADTLAAVLVALMVTKIGVGLILDGLKELVDTSLPAAKVAEIRAVIEAVEGVQGIHLLRTRRMGEDAYIDAHIVVDPRITVSEGHCIGDAVRDTLIARFDDMADVLVHVDPEDDQHAAGCQQALTRPETAKLLAEYLPSALTGVADFRLHYLGGKTELEILLPLAFGQQPEQLATLAQQCQALRNHVRQLDEVVVFFKM